MSNKSGPIPFQPAPRPQPRVSPEQTRELAEATRDLGFGRTTSAPAAAPAEAEPQAAAPTAPTPTITKAVQRAPRSGAAKTAKASPPAPANTPVSDRTATLKIAMPDEIWNALRMAALNRRVTVKYLVLEALAAKGYDIDLSQIAEDGRRLR
jgi:hypothetical protein